jgi:hypothetical protein
MIFFCDKLNLPNSIHQRRLSLIFRSFGNAEKHGKNIPKFFYTCFIIG